MNLELIRTFLSVAELGSLSRAAERMRVSQSTLTRQMHSLENEIGGRLLDRGPAGIALTALGHDLIAQLEPVMLDFDRALTRVRERARGQSSALRVGYLLSAAPCYLNPALAALRKTHRDLKLHLLDLSPGEQMTALRQGNIDIGLIGQTGTLLAREFYIRRLAVLPLLVALSETHPLAAAKSVQLTDLRAEMFVGALEADLPGHNRWISQLCKTAGFRARFVQDADSLSHGLSLVVTEGAVSLVPDFGRHVPVPGVAFKPLIDRKARWELIVAWQRGKASAPVRALLDALPADA